MRTSTGGASESQGIQAPGDGEVGRAFRGRVEPILGRVDQRGYRHAVRHLTQGRAEPGLVEQRWVDLAPDVPELLQDRVQFLLDGVDGLVEIGSAGGRLVPDEADLEGERGDPQCRTIMQLPFQAATT